MANERKNANDNGRGSPEKDDANRPRHTGDAAGQSQDELRHQQDAAHHKGHKSPQQPASDRKVD